MARLILRVCSSSSLFFKSSTATIASPKIVKPIHSSVYYTQDSAAAFGYMAFVKKIFKKDKKGNKFWTLA